MNKAGIIGGNYYNVLTDSTLPVHGAALKKTTQPRCTWIVGDQKTTIYDTGIANLTKDESPLLIHFGKDRTQEWLLVRVKDQDGEAPPAAKSGEQTRRFHRGAGIATITVIVPADAEVYFDGTLTSQTGTQRVYHTPQLEPNLEYHYTVRARWTQDGSPVERVQTVRFKVGSQPRVDFNSPLP